MINYEKFEFNLSKLKKSLPVKSDNYSFDYPKTFNEVFLKYSNQSSVNSFQMVAKLMNENNWPLPLWVDPQNIKIGFWNNLFIRKFLSRSFLNFFSKNFRVLNSPFYWSYSIIIRNLFFKGTYDDGIKEAFKVNKTYIKSQLLNKKVLKNKSILINEIFLAYESKHWASCISLIFPLIDYVSRILLKTSNLTKDVGQIVKFFNQYGINIENADHLMVFATLTSTLEDRINGDMSQQDFDLLYQKIKDNKFGMFGPALSSFVKFSCTYYGYYKEDGVSNEILNRHAILHGSVNLYGTQMNAIKMLTYLYLLLEMEPIFMVLLEE